MKKAYVTPEIEKIEFQYRDQVVATSSICIVTKEVVPGTNTCSGESAVEKTKE